VRQYPNLVRGLKLFDIVVMVSCFTVAAVLIAPGFDVASIREFLQLRISLGNFLLLGAFVAVWYVLYSGFGLYEDSLNWNGLRKATDVLIATSIGTCAIVALAVPFDISFVDARFMLIFWTSVSTIAFGGRLLTRNLLLSRAKKEANLRRILVVGANPRSIEVAKKLEANPLLSSRLVGFVDDSADHAPGFRESGYELVAQYGELADYLGRTAIDEVLICLPIKSRSEDIKMVVTICEEQGISVGILRDLFQANLANSDIRQVGEQTIFMVRPHAINDAQAATKRSVDILISAALIVVLSPVFVIAAVLVKLTSPGPVSFDQERVGLNKKLFRMHKFRTMVVDADQQQAALELLNEADGPAFKIYSDPRITPVGKFLRKYSVDEMPQLFNVLRGEMSLVGPRPLPIRDYAGFNKDWHRRRVSVRPGITGLWQVECRDHNSFEEWIRLDLEYIDRWSLWLDFQIMLKTIPAVLKGSGA
jgi:exopolysaccharide biosynthesis polyprenyl glycosylphosphotransferase